MHDRDQSGLLFVLRLPIHPLSVTAARRLVHSLDGWIDDVDLCRAELIASELVTNAIRHGSDSDTDAIEMDVEAVDGCMSMRFRDSGPPFEMATDDARRGDSDGFGLRIAGGLADSMTVRRLAAGNEVRATVLLGATRLFSVK
ncbi:MAG TPA: ATP-binding protein [Actinomycetota bacterium]|nr:ATP-binding protein [Actinomycetota bacterium]